MDKEKDYRKGPTGFAVIQRYYSQVKFIYSKKATKFREISTNYLTGSTYSDVSIKNIDILPNQQYIANTADSAQEQYS